MKLVILITADTKHGLEVAQAWQEAGAPGVTILPSHGLYTLQEEVKRGSVELPRMITSMGTAMAYIIDHAEKRTQLILSVVENDMVDKLQEAATSVLGDLSQPHHGVMFVLPVERAIGVLDHTQQKTNP